MKRIEIVVDTLDELKETEKEVSTTRYKSKYKTIEIYCREISSAVEFQPSPTEDNQYIYFKVCE